MATIMTILRILSIVDYWTCAKGSSAKTRGHAALVIFRLTSSGVSCGRCGCCGHGDLSPNWKCLQRFPIRKVWFTLTPPWKQQSQDHSSTFWLVQPSSPSWDSVKSSIHISIYSIIFIHSLCTCAWSLMWNIVEHKQYKHKHISFDFGDK